MRLFYNTGMEISYIIVSILQTISIGLGVGCSTVAISQFFVAIADGKIDESERRMMGVVYTILRVAMVAILLTTLTIMAIIYYVNSVEVVGWQYFSPFIVGQLVVIFVLFANAVAMTKHWISGKFGPSIQAGSWYTLGLMFALMPLGLTGFSYLQFALGYVGILILTTGLVNGIMGYLKK